MHELLQHAHGSHCGCMHESQQNPHTAKNTSRPNVIPTAEATSRRAMRSRGVRAASVAPAMQKKVRNNTALVTVTASVDDERSCVCMVMKDEPEE